MVVVDQQRLPVVKQQARHRGQFSPHNILCVGVFGAVTACREQFALLPGLD